MCENALETLKAANTGFQSCPGDVPGASPSVTPSLETSPFFWKDSLFVVVVVVVVVFIGTDQSSELYFLGQIQGTGTHPVPPHIYANCSSRLSLSDGPVGWGPDLLHPGPQAKETIKLDLL